MTSFNNTKTKATKPSIASNTASPHPPTTSPSQFREQFEAQVSGAKHRALFVAGIHLLSRFLSACALTWAALVLLGGFASSLPTFDFFLVCALLLLEGARLFVVDVFRKSLPRTLFRESARPEEFVFKDTQYKKVNRLDALGQALSCILASASLISSFSHVASSDADSGRNGTLSYALSMFYGLVSLNSCIAITTSLLRPFLRCRCDGRPSGKVLYEQNALMCFHDEVFRTAVDVGFFEADLLDILEFAYTKLLNDYKRNIRPPLIEGQNKDLIRYMYHNQQGIALTCAYLKSQDVWNQLVAANLPGFWAGEPRIELQAPLFWALRERMYGAGKEAESALNSVAWLGRTWADLPESKPYPFLINDPAVDTNIVDTLVHLILEPIRPTLLFQMRAFEACCRNPQVLRHVYNGRSPQEALEMCQELQAMVVGKQHEISEGRLYELCCKLLDSMLHKGMWMASKIYAANALLSLLCYGTGDLTAETIKSLKRPMEEFVDPAGAALSDNGKRPYFWLDDVILVEQMRRKLQMPGYGRWEEVCIRGPDGVELPVQKALALIGDM